MPEATQSAFIWYHADAQLADVLQAWVRRTGKTLGIPSRLMVRSQQDRTTFMEIYELGGSRNMESDIEAMLRKIETNAARQPWFVQLHSPRRAEIFSGIQ